MINGHHHTYNTNWLSMIGTSSTQLQPCQQAAPITHRIQKTKLANTAFAPTSPNALVAHASLWNNRKYSPKYNTTQTPTRTHMKIHHLNPKPLPQFSKRIYQSTKQGKSPVKYPTQTNLLTTNNTYHTNLSKPFGCRKQKTK